jgi:ankyrin repeat protein
MSKALLYAAINGHKDATELLLLHGAMPIHTKCDEYYDECLLCKMIIRRKACIANLLIMHNHVQDNCYKLLIFKIIDKFRDRDDGLNMVKLLLERGIDINVINSKCYMSVLGYACKYKCLNMVKLLLDRGANVNIPIKYKTPLYCAAEGGSCEIGQLLIDKGAKIDAKFRSQESIIYHAITTENEAFAVMLIKNGAKTNIRHKNGRTLINIALDWQQWSVVRLLIKHGADITTYDYNNETVLQRMIALTRNFHTYINDPKTLIYKLIDAKLNTS